MRKALIYLASSHIVFWLMPYLMALLILGTIAQKYIPLYDVINDYFHSWIIWIDVLIFYIPIPGGLTALALLTVALSIKFIFFSTWSWRKSGTILTHLGVLILLVGGLVTITTKEEGFLILNEGQTSDIFADYYQRQLVITGINNTHHFDFSTLKNNQLLVLDGIEITVQNICDNCGVTSPTAEQKETIRHGLAQHMQLIPITSNLKKEVNLSGMMIQIKNPFDTNQDGVYLLMEDIGAPITLHQEKGKNIILSLGRKEHKIPFYVTLDSFDKINYAGTNQAQNYKSHITIHDGALSWPVTIEMNKPYRYAGYTLYQSSFDQTNGIETSVLSIVKNTGILTPYIASGLLFIGLFAHLIIRVYKKIEKR